MWVHPCFGDMRHSYWLMVMSINTVSTKGVVHQRWYAQSSRQSFELCSGYQYRSVMQTKRQHLKAMDSFYFFLENLINQTVLLYDGETSKCRAPNSDSIERPTAT
jgi:hypothetical protein